MNVRLLAVRPIALLLALLAVGGCGGVFESAIPAAQAFVLRLAPRPTATPSTTPRGSVLLQRPEAGPGLDSDRIALLRSDNRFDFYAASRWAAPAPDMVESVIVEALRAGGNFSAVFDDTSPYAPRYSLRVTLRRFEADYTSAGRAPTVYVALDCTLGRHRDRELLASFTAQGSAVASEDRLTAVVAAFEAATATAMAQLEQSTAAALDAEQAPAESKP
ncbi:MAG: ABC-type transport auxiliary lipoprotein family protein [Pseudomonadota bacterium]